MNPRRWPVLGVVSLLASVAWATAGIETSPVLRKGVLTVSVGDYQVDFREAAAWTLGSVFFRKEQLLNYTGANQTVINVKQPVQAGPEAWIGSSHGGENIRSVVLKVDGKPFPLEDSFSAPSGDEYQMVKESEIGPYLVITETTVTADGLRESISFRAQRAADDVRYLYVFMHCWNVALNEWMAFLSDGTEIAETFPFDRVNLLKQDIRGLALYSPEKGVGAVMVYPEAYQGDPGHSNFLAGWPDRHNKHYLRMRPDQVAGRTFVAHIRGFAALSDDWRGEARRMVFPDKEPAP